MLCDADWQAGWLAGRQAGRQLKACELSLWFLSCSVCGCTSSMRCVDLFLLSCSLTLDKWQYRTEHSVRAHGLTCCLQTNGLDSRHVSFLCGTLFCAFQGVAASLGVWTCSC
jgi:hypothetical protein